MSMALICCFALVLWSEAMVCCSPLTLCNADFGLAKELHSTTPTTQCLTKGAGSANKKKRVEKQEKIMLKGRMPDPRRPMRSAGSLSEAG